jgi:hypothetical protein
MFCPKEDKVKRMNAGKNIFLMGLILEELAKISGNDE